MRYAIKIWTQCCLSQCDNTCKFMFIHVNSLPTLTQFYFVIIDLVKIQIIKTTSLATLYLIPRRLRKLWKWKSSSTFVSVPSYFNFLDVIIIKHFVGNICIISHPFHNHNLSDLVCFILLSKDYMNKTSSLIINLLKMSGLNSVRLSIAK